MIRARRALFQNMSVAAVALLAVIGASSWQSGRAETGETVIVAFGDSLTAGLGLPESQAFPARLEAVLRAKGRNVKVVNAGVSGDTSTAGLARLDWSLPDEADAVIVELGANDALQGLPPEATKEALEKVLTGIEAKKLPILFAGMEAPRNMGKDYVDSFGAIFPDLAKSHDVVFYPFFLNGIGLDPTLMQGDGMHPNAKGVEKIVEDMLPKVEELLAKVEAKKEAMPPPQ